MPQGTQAQTIRGGVASILCNFAQQVVTKTEAYLRFSGHKHCLGQVGYKHQFTFKLQWSDQTPLPQVMFPSGHQKPNWPVLAALEQPGKWEFVYALIQKGSQGAWPYLYGMYMYIILHS